MQEPETNAVKHRDNTRKQQEDDAVAQSKAEQLDLLRLTQVSCPLSNGDSLQADHLALHRRRSSPQP